METSVVYSRASCDNIGAGDAQSFASTAVLLHHSSGILSKLELKIYIETFCLFSTPVGGAQIVINANAGDQYAEQPQRRAAFCRRFMGVIDLHVIRRMVANAGYKSNVKRRSGI